MRCLLTLLAFIAVAQCSIKVINKCNSTIQVWSSANPNLVELAPGQGWPSFAPFLLGTVTIRNGSAGLTQATFTKLLPLDQYVIDINRGFDVPMAITYYSAASPGVGLHFGVPSADWRDRVTGEPITSQTVTILALDSPALIFCGVIDLAASTTAAPALPRAV